MKIVREASIKEILILLAGVWVSFGIGYFDNARPYKDA